MLPYIFFALLLFMQTVSTSTTAEEQAILLTGEKTKTHPDTRQQQQQQRRVLFIANSESGQATELLATCHALLVHHPDVEVHIASFPRLGNLAGPVSEYAQKQSPEAKPIVFHALSGPNLQEALMSRGIDMVDAVNAPGLAGEAKFLDNLQRFILPWNGSEYEGIYHDIVRVIKEVAPAVVMTDPTFPPVLNAVRDLGQKYMILSANAFKDNFAQMQPAGAMFWKYPALSSGYPYPVPWYLIPANILYNIRLIASMLRAPALREAKDHLKRHGFDNPIDIFHVYDKDVPWLSPSLPETDYPMIIPPNVTPCGPIYLSLAPVSEQDPELASWLERAPTVLINLGSHVKYGEPDSIQMVGAIKRVLDRMDVQVLWKFRKTEEFDDSFLEPIAQEIKSGRVRLVNWINADVGSLLESGRIALSVHHGGSNCFHEAIATGVPQVILPMWVDLYDFAVRAEWLGVGVWGSRKHAPWWTAEELGDAFLKVLGDSDEAAAIRKKAKELGELSSRTPGRVVAAQKIVEYVDLQLQGGTDGARADEKVDREL